LVAALQARSGEVEACASIDVAGRRAHAAASPGDRVVVFGSFHAVAAALRSDWA
jgi:folylpolyglutamate synthase/dihydropteroate synthase